MSADVDAARETLLRILPGPDQHGNGIAWRQRLDTFETAVRAAALDEADAAIEKAQIGEQEIARLTGRTIDSVLRVSGMAMALAAIDALRAKP